jgi:hypothetical protein
MLADGTRTPIITKQHASDEFVWKTSIRHKPPDLDAENQIVVRSQSVRINYTPEIVDMIA